MRTSPILGLATVLAALTAAGCAGGPGTKAAAVDNRPPVEVVRERATERWNLLLKRDFAAAYAFLSEGARSMQSQDAYASGLGSRPVTWLGAEIRDVECEPEGEVCSVIVNVHYSIKSTLPGVGQVSSQSPVTERWINTGSGWGYAPQEIVRQ